MASRAEVRPSPSFRKALRERGGAAAFRCFQCATCTSVCQLASEANPFPRRQMLYAQWGLADRLAADPAVWLCHQCNDCTARCPRDAKPGDALQTVRALVVEELAAPKLLGKLVGKAASTWPLLVGLPFLFWIFVLHSVNGFAVPAAPLVWEEFVPHGVIYATFIPVTVWAVLAVWIGGRRHWRLMGAGANRSGSFTGHLVKVLVEIATHKRFGSCDAARPRKTGHLLFLWGFVAAAVTTGLTIVAMYGWNAPMPFPQAHPFKWIGNLAAVLLVVGGGILVYNRLRGGEGVGGSTAFDNFFLWVAVMVGLTGALTEVGRLAFAPRLAAWIYVAHLSFVLTLFFTFPYSKFAHLVYRTLAMVHERMTTSK